MKIDINKRIKRLEKLKAERIKKQASGLVLVHDVTIDDVFYEYECYLADQEGRLRPAAPEHKKSWKKKEDVLTLEKLHQEAEMWDKINAKRQKGKL